MVKPPKTMQPEAVDLSKAGRDAQKSFGEDSFHNYMARKIDMQRQQFGLMLPPPPPDSVQRRGQRDGTHSCRQKRKRKKFGIGTVLKRLKKIHGPGNRPPLRNKRKLSLQQGHQQQQQEEESPYQTISSLERHVEETDTHEMASVSMKQPVTTVSPKKNRTDLFFCGVVVMCNGYTDPDVETLQRLLHKHGGDLEKYETSRVTHIIAERLSFAKAKMYRAQKRPRPVCKPAWIVDSVQAGKQLPCSMYLLEEMKDDSLAGTKSVASFFRKADTGVQITSSATESTTQTDTVSSVQKASAPTNNKMTVTGTPIAQNRRPKVSFDLNSPSEQNDKSSPTRNRHSDKGRFINGRVRTVGTDPDFLESFFENSRLSFIGSYQQRTRQSPVKKNLRSTEPNKLFVFHIDMDSFFASVVLRNYPEYRDKPVAISHHGERQGRPDDRHIPKASTSECATCNYHARSFGIKKGMFLSRARELCPGLIVLQYDFEGYEEVSEAVADILDRYAENYNGFVEIVSCDEAYVEFRIPEGEESSSSVVAKELAESIRKDIFDATHCTATIGISTNKLLAKLATDSVKPDGCTVLEDYKSLLASLELKNLHGVGWRSNRKLQAEGLATIQDVLDMESQGEAELCRILGPGVGRKIYGYCLGRDDRLVKPKERKTIGAECNYGVRFDGPHGVDCMITGLCREVEKRMINVGVRGSKVTLKVKQRKQGARPPPKFLGHGSCHNLSKSRDVTGGRATRDHKKFADMALELFDALKVPKDDVRGMGIVISNLVADSVGLGDKGNSLTNWLCRDDDNDDDRKSHPKNDVGDESDSPSNVEGEPSDEVRKDVQSDEPFVDLTAEDLTAEVRKKVDDEVIDIQLPSLSQLHMSQVEQLPSPMRRKIYSKIKAAQGNGDDSQRDPSQRNGEGRFRQTNLQRMLRLAAVKAGDEELTDVSLTQFERLPLEKQLQIANNDYQKLGHRVSGSPPKRSKPRLGKGASPSKRSSPKASKNVAKRPTATTAEPKSSFDCFSESTLDRREFYEENVVPLHAFLDANMTVGQEELNQLVDFFRVLVSENRLKDVQVLLRSVLRRNDGWSEIVPTTVFEAVDVIVKEQLGTRLDREGILNQTGKW